jgi:soluble P-type ATPase
MLDITIPNFGALSLTDLVFDYNGTLAVDGRLIPGAKPRLQAIAATLSLHVVTADTFGLAAEALAGLPCRLTVLPPGDQAAAKAALVRELGASQVVAIGNGRNDRLMLEAAALGIAVINEEGAATQTLLSADVVCRHILDALAFFTEPRRLIATLRA